MKIIHDSNSARLRPPANRSGEMEVFVRVAMRGSLSSAARDFRMSPSAVSKLVSRLEARLGVRLLERSTRKMQLTAEGVAYATRAQRILADIDAAEREVAPGPAARGRLRVNANVPFGQHVLLPLLPRFLAAYPQVTVDVALTDAVVDLYEARADVAIRLGPLTSSRLVARKLGESRMLLVAAPSYLDRQGTPRTPAELEDHNCLAFCFVRQAKGWPLLARPHPHPRTAKRVTFLPSGNALVSDGEAMRRLAVAGAGIARLAHFHVRADLESGALVPLLEAYDPRETEPAHAVFRGDGGRMPTRVRVFLDFLSATVRLSSG